MYSNIVQTTLNSFHNYFKRNIDYCLSHPAARVSAFWNTHFNDRLNFPNIQEFMIFRRTDFLYGIGDTKQSNSEQKLLEFNQTLDSISLFVPLQFIQHLQEPTFGAPQVFTSQDFCLSTSFLLNAGTTWRVNDLIQCYGTTRRPLHIVEIGAGWGACAYQLHHVANIGSYTIIDLPENLCLSSTYLSTTISAKSTVFIDCGADQSFTPSLDHLYFALPPAIDNLPGKYDVLLNTVSLQEMDKETVTEYFEWGAKSLADDGIMISFNSHDKAGIKRPSEYLYKGLKLIHLKPFRKIPAGFFNTIPYEMVFIKAQDHIHAENLSIAIDVYGEMIQLGLDSDLIPSITETLSGKITGSSIIQLKLLKDFFYTRDEKKRESYAIQLTKSNPSAAIIYLLGSYWLVSGELTKAASCFEESLKQGLQDFAAVRAKTLLALLYTTSDERQTSLLQQIKLESGGLYDEILQIIKTRNLPAMQNHIARVLDYSIHPSGKFSKLMRKIKYLLS